MKRWSENITRLLGAVSHVFAPMIAVHPCVFPAQFGLALGTVHADCADVSKPCPYFPSLPGWCEAGCLLTVEPSLFQQPLDKVPSWEDFCRYPLGRNEAGHGTAPVHLLMSLNTPTHPKHIPFPYIHIPYEWREVDRVELLPPSHTSSNERSSGWLRGFPLSLCLRTKGGNEVHAAWNAQYTLHPEIKSVPQRLRSYSRSNCGKCPKGWEGNGQEMKKETLP